ncbi:hypothetical protein V6N13_130180 [Hibiscus sabdariffa]|uniref:Uncharacterized protein n=1 Tax=Hibiscus sabdariffa TaxID=183260 RepID=A0ABR2SP98_9ROSI
MTLPMLNLKPVSIALINTSLVRSTVWLWEVCIKFHLTKVFHNFASGWRCGRLIVFAFLPFTFHFMPASHSWSLIVSKSSSSSTSSKTYMLGLSLGRSRMLLMVAELAGTFLPHTDTVSSPLALLA